MKKYTEEDFKQKLDSIMKQTVQTESGCLEFPKIQKGNKYYVVFFCGRYITLSRCVWILINGPIKKGSVNHSCRNPKCINIEHLFLSTNPKKYLNKRKINNHPAQKLSENDIARIIELRKKGLSYQKIGNQFGVTRQAIHLQISNPLNYV